MRSNLELPICNGSERLKNGKNSFNTKTRALLHRILLATSNKNDLILDPFWDQEQQLLLLKLGRNFYGIEKEKTYLKAVNKIKKYKTNRR